MMTYFQVLTSGEEKKEGKTAVQGDDQDPDKVDLYSTYRHDVV